MSSTWSRLEGRTPVNRAAASITRPLPDSEPPPDSPDRELLLAQQEAAYWRAAHDDLLDHHAETVRGLLEIIKAGLLEAHNVEDTE